MKPLVICWFRQDLRLADNPALSAALEHGWPVVPLYIDDHSTPREQRPGAAARWWLHHSLAALDRDLRSRGSRLVLARGPATEVIADLVRTHRVGAVHWNRCYEPHATARDAQIKNELAAASITATSHNGALMFEPWQISTAQGSPYKVFSQFWRRGCLRSGIAIRSPWEAPQHLPPVPRVSSDTLDDWCLLPVEPDWACGFRPAWQPGEQGAATKLARFVDAGLAGYRELRDRPDLEHVSRLSPHLHWGEIAPWRVWHAVAAEGAARAEIGQKDVDHFHSEMGWREFAYHLLFHWPTLPTDNWRCAFDAFPWRRDDDSLEAWQRGRTGYPLVDAGMRELWATGWMHNRVRMVAASFLIKHLLIDWRAGERWFWDTLVDADLANNSAGWQWVAGSGADASPYFRIFNPIIQSRKFDPDGVYIRRWVPELAALDDRHIHTPWEADEAVLREAGITLGQSYPRPLVDHAQARERALAGYQQAKAAAEAAD